MKTREEDAPALSEAELADVRGGVVALSGITRYEPGALHELSSATLERRAVLDLRLLRSLRGSPLARFAAPTAAEPAESAPVTLGLLRID